MADIGRKRMVRVTYNHGNEVLYRASTYNTQILNALLFLMVVATRLFQYIYIYIFLFTCKLYCFLTDQLIDKWIQTLIFLPTSVCVISVVSLFFESSALAKSTMDDVTEEEAEEDGIEGTEDEGILDVLNDESASFYKSDFF